MLLFKSGDIGTGFADSCRRVQIVPLREGSLQLTVTDLCLPALSSATASVIISDIGSIVVDVIDKVQQNNEILARVRVLDYSQRPILREHFSLMDLHLIAGSNIISIRWLLTCSQNIFMVCCVGK